MNLKPHRVEVPGEPSYPKMPGEPPRVQPSKKVAAHWDEIMSQPVVEVPAGRPFGTKMMQGYRP